MKTIKYQLVNGIATLIFDEPNSLVNTMCQDWQTDLTAVVAQIVSAKDKIKGIVLTSAKTTFFAGADLKRIMRLQPTDVARCYAEIELVKKNFRTLETIGKPVVSCLNGSALGGGWELALVGHYRIAMAGKDVQLGLPEVTLGLLPGAGGVTKMVRHLGLLRAQSYLIDGRIFGPQEALELGLVHELVNTAAQLQTNAVEYINAQTDNLVACQHPWDHIDYKIPGGKPSSPGLATALTVAPAMLLKQTRGLLPAPEAILACMVDGAMVDFDTALRIESRYLARLLTGINAKAMINTFFFNMNAIKSGVSRPQGVDRFKPIKVGILGAGMMGAGIAYAQASKGIVSVIKDVTVERAQAGKAYSKKITALRVSKGKLTEEAQADLLACITPTANTIDLQNCDLIIEAVFEQRALKASVTKEAEPMLVAGGFFASNTSTLPITGLAEASSHPSKFIGIHFFSPVEKMKLVEIIRGKKTDDETVARAYDYVQALGKIPIVVNDSRGFYTSRTFGTFVMEGVTMLSEGIPAAAIENGGIQAGMPVGPLAVIDETSLSLSMHVIEQTMQDYATEGKLYSAMPGEQLLRQMVKEFKRAGRASGGGFYDYPEVGKKTLWSGLVPHYGKNSTAWDVRTIKDRLLYRQAIETARCLHEGVLSNVPDGNIGSIFGIGFPAWTGGAMQFIYGMGIDVFAKRAAELAVAHGSGFALDTAVLETISRHQPVY
jgi:3-hydroxyacyl-CoA dehydrogenase / enoyl-CoA hydratase / 3-hydroxybutyryl-CoA epimerase